MKISPIGMSIGTAASSQAAQSSATQSTASSTGYIPTTHRKNSLADMEFNIIADTIRCQNLKNQMNVRIMNLRYRLNNCMAQNLYSQEK